MSRLPECVTCGARLHRDVCRDCVDLHAEYLAEMDTDYWEGGDD
jgi:hypothetical protein